MTLVTVWVFGLCLQCFDTVDWASGFGILSDEVLAWLVVWSEMQMICIWSSWCYCVCLCVCLCVYVCVRLCICPCLYVCMCVCVCIYVSVCVCMSVYVSCLCVCVCMSLCVCLCICLCLCVCVCVCVCMSMWCMSLYISACMSVYMSLSVCVCLCVYVSVCMSVYMSLSVYVCVCVCVCSASRLDDLLTPAPLSDKSLENHTIFRVPIIVVPGELISLTSSLQVSWWTVHSNTHQAHFNIHSTLLSRNLWVISSQVPTSLFSVTRLTVP